MKTPKLVDYVISDSKENPKRYIEFIRSLIKGEKRISLNTTIIVAVSNYADNIGLPREEICQLIDLVKRELNIK